MHQNVPLSIDNKSNGEPKNNTISNHIGSISITNNTINNQVQ